MAHIHADIKSHEITHLTIPSEVAGTDKATGIDIWLCWFKMAMLR